MTPEEKLLALIQQDKRQEVPPPASQPVVIPPPAVERPQAVVIPQPVANPTHSQPLQGGEREIKQGGVGTGAAVPQSVEKKLKLAEPKPEVRELKSEIRDQVSEIRDPVPETVISVPLYPAFRVSRVVVLNRILGGVTLALGLMVFYSVAATQRSIDADVQRQVNGAGVMAVTPLSVTDDPVPSVDIFLEKAGMRDFFVPKVTQRDKSGPVVTPEPTGMAKDLTLVAVSMDSATESESMAIIKNKSNSKTYFVKVGGSVGDTGFVLEKVLVDRIILEQRKQKFELKH